jgi:MFS family permease
MEMLKHEWQISSVAEGLVTSTALLASAVGAVLFGRIGRRQSVLTPIGRRVGERGWSPAEHARRS